MPFFFCFKSVSMLNNRPLRGTASLMKPCQSTLRYTLGLNKQLLEISPVSATRLVNKLSLGEFGTLS